MLSRAESYFLITDSKNSWVFINPFGDPFGGWQLQDNVRNETKCIGQMTDISQILLNRGSRFARKWGDSVQVYNLKQGVRVWTWFVGLRILSSDRPSRAEYCVVWGHERRPVTNCWRKLRASCDLVASRNRLMYCDVIAQVYLTKTKDRSISCCAWESLTCDHAN